MSLKNINFSYGKDEPNLISDFSIHIGKNDRICIIGKNGKGKSTLMRIMAGKLPQTSGNITTHPSLKIGYYAQTNVAELNAHRMVYEEIMSANPKCLPEQARTISGTLMFSGDIALKKVSVLSGGEKSRVLLGKILVQESHLLLLDEPTNHLDMESCESLLDAVNEFDGSVVMVTHDEMYLHTIATRLVIFDRDKITLFEGTYQDFLDNIGWEDDAKTSEVSLKSVKKDKSVDAKAEKRLKAELLQKKSRTLKPLETEIKKLENDIMTLEAEKIKNIELLAKASADRNIPLLTELSQRNSLVGTQIESLFSKLEVTSNKYAIESKKFNP
jgi:ATP-binding cassette subfamily F protein 3